MNSMQTEVVLLEILKKQPPFANPNTINGSKCITYH